MEDFRSLLILFQGLTFVLSNSVTPSLYLGVGYNILRGNPDGGEWARLGQDPGLLITRNILETSFNGTSFIKQVPYPYCFPASSTSVFYDAKSYQDYMMNYIRISGRASDEIYEYAFTKNQLYLDVKWKTITQHDVFRDEITSCLSDHARFVIPQIRLQTNLVTTEFARDVCQLPTVYEPSAYRNFIEHWGTHVTSEVDFGERNFTRSRLSVADLAEYILNSHIPNAAGLRLEKYGGYGSVVELNMSHIHHSDFLNLPNGLPLIHHYTPLKLPMEWDLLPLAEVFQPLYWQNMNGLIRSGICNTFSSSNLSVWRNNVETAFHEFPSALGVELPHQMIIKLPVTWPSGTYGLYMPISGCPLDPVGFETGYLTQDTENNNNLNNQSTLLHIKGTVNSGTITTNFCIKRPDTSKDYSREWPRGDYCILKKNNCPGGFEAGHIHIDDQDGSNSNSHAGVLPDGNYGRDTDLYFCCRHDGPSSSPILLPVDKPFFLLRYHQHCQQVLGMEVTQEYIRFDTEDEHNKDSCSGAYPYFGTTCRDFTFNFCYYNYKRPDDHVSIDIPEILGKK